MKNNLLILLLFVTIFGCKKGPSPVVIPPIITIKDTSFANPLLSSGPDPWVIKKDSFYYYMHTSGDRIRVWQTRAMSKLSTATSQTIWTKPSIGFNSQNVWAPELHYLDGKWYAYYTAGSSASDLSTQRMFVLENSSADPLQGTWADKGKLFDPAADFFAIDETVFEHGGKRYLLWSGQQSATDRAQRIYIAEMSNPYTLSTSRSVISSPQFSWESIGAPPAVNEGPEIIKNAAGKVFLVYSASGCWTDDYALGMMALKDGGNPMIAADWTKNPQPVFTKNPQNGAYGPGHNAFFKSPDGKEDWIIYHANPFAGQGCSDTRSPRMQKFTWNADGTPNFGQPVLINSNMPRPSGEPAN